MSSFKVTVHPRFFLVQCSLPCLHPHISHPTRTFSPWRTSSPPSRVQLMSSRSVGTVEQFPDSLNNSAKKRTYCWQICMGKKAVPWIKNELLYNLCVLLLCQRYSFSFVTSTTLRKLYSLIGLWMCVSLCTLWGFHPPAADLLLKSSSRKCAGKHLLTISFRGEKNVH